LFGGVVLGDSGSADSELDGFSISHGPGLAIPGEALLGLGAFDTWGELIVPHELGFGGVVLGDSGSADSELGGFSISHEPGLAVPGEALLGLGAFDTWGELLVPHELVFCLSFGVSLLDSGFFIEESGKISCGYLYDRGSKKKNPAQWNIPIKPTC
jgi:hypothetical protein